MLNANFKLAKDRVGLTAALLTRFYPHTMSESLPPGLVSGVPTKGAELLCNLGTVMPEVPVICKVAKDYPAGSS